MVMADFDRLTKASLWKNVLFVLIGFAVPAFVRRVVELDSEGNPTGTDLPNELYGVGGMVLAMMFLDGSMATYTTTGAGAYTGAKLLERFDVIQPVEIRLQSG